MLAIPHNSFFSGSRSDIPVIRNNVQIYCFHKKNTSPPEELGEVNLVQRDYILPFITSRGLSQALCNTYPQNTLHNTKCNIANDLQDIVAYLNSLLNVTHWNSCVASAVEGVEKWWLSNMAGEVKKAKKGKGKDKSGKGW